jgi:hypothetical protein
MTDVGTVLEAEKLLVGYAGAPVCGAVSVTLWPVVLSPSTGS